MDMRKLPVSIGLSALLFVAVSSSQALAWGCTAVASDGAYGYSYNWPDEEDAELKALQECDKQTGTNDCQRESCDPNG
jgi:hypothetical protein